MCVSLDGISRRGVRIHYTETTDNGGESPLTLYNDPGLGSTTPEKRTDPGRMYHMSLYIDPTCVSTTLRRRIQNGCPHNTV